MDWANVLSISPNQLTVDELDAIPNHLSSVDVNTLNIDELRKFFELSRFIIDHLSNVAHGNKQLRKDSSIDKKLLKGSDTDESYYIQTIQELNREIAQHVFNKKAPSSGDDGATTAAGQASSSADVDALQPLAIDTKKDLLYKIHVKNKYIKRLLSENETLKASIEQQNEQILLLNVSLKQTTHKLAKAIGDLSEQKTRNHMTADDMAALHAKINSVREQMTRIESDKQKYKHDVLYLGDEIQKKINQWNELLKRKYSAYHANEKATANDDGNGGGGGGSDGIKSAAMNHHDGDNNNDGGDLRISDIDGQAISNTMRYDENRFEVNVLSQAISKRNLIITEMESLLIDLTMEISQSAVVINRIIANLSKRETHFACNLEKLRNHLAKLLERPPNDSPNVNDNSKTLHAPKHTERSFKRKNGNKIPK